MSGESMPKIITQERVTSKFLRRTRTLGARDLADFAGWLSSHRSNISTSFAMRPCVVEGLQVKAQGVPNMTVQIETGMGFVSTGGASSPIGAGATNEDSNFVMLNKRTATASQVITAADPTNIRYDLIELMPTASPATVGVDESQVVDIYDTGTDTYIPTGAPQPVMVHGEPDVVYTAGVAGAANSCPSPTAGRLPVGVVRVLAAATTITQQDILDVRVFLGELLDSAGLNPSWIDTEEFSIDLPAGGTNERKAVINLDVQVRGLRGSFRTDALFQLDNTAGTKAYESFLDPTFNDFAVYTGWVYFYMVVADDKGLRYSRARCTTEVDVAGGDFSHAGALTISKVAPSLAGGSLAPSGAFRTPTRCGNSPVGGALSKAVCVGVMWWQSTRLQHGIRMVNGQASFVEDDNLLPACFFGAWTHVAAGAASAYQISSFQADLTLASNPKGPLTFDIYSILAIATPAISTQQRLRVYEKKATDASESKLIGLFEQGSFTGGLSTQARAYIFKDVPVSRISTERGTVTNGVMIRLESGGPLGTAHSSELSAGAPPTTKLVGYRWPQGPVVA